MDTDSDNVLFKISIELDDKTEYLLVHGDDQPEILCEEFAKANNLNSEQQQKLLEGINECIENLARSQENTEKPSQSIQELFLDNNSKKTPKKKHLKKTSLKKPQALHKNCLSTNPVLTHLESANSRHKRFRILVQPKCEVFSFHPEINKK